MCNARFRLALLGALIAGASANAADLKLPALFADHMVIQRETDAPVWGWANPNDKVQIDASWGAKAEATADSSGAWKTKLKTPAAGGPFTINIACGMQKRVLDDVLSGEVWLCSGQSNMEFRVGPEIFGVENWEQEAAAANHPQIRLIDVPNTVSAVPLSEFKGQWKVCSPETVKSFTAAGYFFARELQSKLNVPIGLIDSDWGGTPAQAWTSLEVISTFDAYKDGVAAIREIGASPESFRQKQEEKQTAWWKNIDTKDAGLKNGWATPTFNDQDWGVTKVPGNWTGDLAQFDGVVWQRIGVDIPAVWEGRTLTLDLGPIDDFDTTWFNGTKVGETFSEGAHTKNRSYTVPKELVKAGRAVIAVRIVDIMGPGGIYGKAEGIKIHPADDFEGVMLTENWRVKSGAPMTELGPVPQLTSIGPWMPASLYNGMIAPLLPYAIRGAIWYQGESNRDHAEIYQKLFTAMITDWRTRWGRGDFPFYFVQIAPYKYGDLIGRSAEVREAQRLTLSLANTGMAVTTDISNLADIHPKNKQDVGKRLALWALAKTYGVSGIEFSGPLYKKTEFSAGKARVSFEHGKGLTAHGKPLADFEIAGSDGKFVPAKAEIDGEAVVVHADGVTEPKSVRYGFSDTAECSLWNDAGLPASPFTSASGG